jgi:spore germination cell wall hydrolase CwlJ-like protein
MNTQVNANYGKTTPPFIEYAIEDRPYPRDTHVGVKTPFDHKIVLDTPQDGSTHSADDYGQQTSHFAPGTDIPGVVDNLFARTNTGIQIARVSREMPPADGPDIEQTVRDPASILHRIETKVEYTGYNAIYGDYSKKITYIVKPYQSLRLLTSLGKAMNFDREPKLNKMKAALAVQQVMMCKQYDYIFTGMNTEIEKFDISTNFRWAVSVPVVSKWNNYSGSTERVDNAKTVNNAAASELSAQGKQARAVELNNNEKKRADDLDAQASKETDAAKRAELVRQAQQIRAQTEQNQKVLEGSSTVLGGAITTTNNQLNAATNKRRESRPSSRTVDGEDDIYGNAVDGENNSFQGATQDGQSFLPVTITQDADSPSATTRIGSSNDNNPNKSIFGALLNQMYGSFDGNLQDLTLDIRGDPYWLGPGGNGEIYDEPSTIDIPNYMNGEHMFVFRFKLPPGPEVMMGNHRPVSDSKDGSGLSDIYTGFYFVRSVTHHFREGKFTQTLDAVRVQGWSYENIIEGKEASVADGNDYSNTDAPDANPAVPGARPSSSGSGSNAAGGPTGGNIDERTLLALTMYGEARGEGARGMQAVGNVIMNRTKIGRGGNNTSEVIMAKRQFSIWGTDDITRSQGGITPTEMQARIKTPAQKQDYQTAYSLAGDLLAGKAQDITGGATSYYNPKKASPAWGNKGTTTAVIGNHKFKKGV